MKRKKYFDVRVSPKELRAIAKEMMDFFHWTNVMTQKQREVFLTEGKGRIFSTLECTDGTFVDISWFPKQTKNGKFRC